MTARLGTLLGTLAALFHVVRQKLEGNRRKAAVFQTAVFSRCSYSNRWATAVEQPVRYSVPSDL